MTSIEYYYIIDSRKYHAIFNTDLPVLNELYQDHNIPFFGILPKSLLSVAYEKENFLNVDQWLRLFINLEILLDDHYNNDVLLDKLLLQEDLDFGINLYEQNKVNSFTNSLLLCLKCVRQLIILNSQNDKSEEFRIVNIRQLQTVTVSFIKEGHTSSVWKLDLDYKDGETTSFCFNINRDKSASKELKLTHSILSNLYNCVPDQVAKPILLLEGSIEGFSFLKGNCVFIQEWIEGLELHVRGYQDDEPLELIVIENFISPIEKQDHGTVNQVLGRKLDHTESNEFWTQYLKFVITTAKKDANQKIKIPIVDLNEGDIVWDTHSSKMVVVACSSDYAHYSQDRWNSFGESPYLFVNSSSTNLKEIYRDKKIILSDGGM